MDSEKNSRVARFATYFIVFVAWMGFELFNAITTVRTADGLLHDQMLAICITGAIVGMDIAGLARIFTPNVQGKKEPFVVKALFLAWLIVALINALATWWGTAIGMESSQIVAPKAAATEAILSAIPWLVAVVVFLMRVLLTAVFGYVLDEAIGKSRRSSPSFAHGPVSVPQPVPAYRTPTPSPVPPSAQPGRPGQGPGPSRG